MLRYPQFVNLPTVVTLSGSVFKSLNIYGKLIKIFLELSWHVLLYEYVFLKSDLAV